MIVAVKRNKKGYLIKILSLLILIGISAAYYVHLEKKHQEEIKKELEKTDIIVSLRKIRTIMKKNGLVSNYTIKQFKVIKSKYNEDGVENILNREFNREKNMDVIVSDLTYVNVAGKWNYICLILDLYNREIVGYAAGRNKTASFYIKHLVQYDLI